MRRRVFRVYYVEVVDGGYWIETDNGAKPKYIIKNIS